MKQTRAMRRVGAVAAAVVVGALALTGCSSGSNSSTTSAGSGTGNITIWAHDGQAGENAALQTAVKGFNSSHSKIHATLKLLPQATYTTTISNTPTSKLPDVMELDGPTLASYVYNGKVAPVKSYVPAATVNNATAGAIAEGTINGKLYALPMYDSALGLYGNKKLLDAAGVTYPTSPSDAWTPSEFLAALKTLAAANPSGKALDISQASLNGEWGTYGFSPLLQSAGANLIKNGKSSGVLDSSAAVTAMTDFQSWKPYVDANTDGNAFQDGRVALSWSGHWEYPAYSAAVGSNLVDLPLPNMGDGTKTGAGSWTWGVGADTKQGKAAGEFLAYLLNDKNVTAMTTADGAPPATKTAFAADKLYQPGGGLALFGEQLQHACPASNVTASCVAVYRPSTAGYPTITAKFASALAAIYNGADVKSQLSTAATAIDQAFSNNDGFK
jgi:multiple sugar transport system substrate-binding protein